MKTAIDIPDDLYTSLKIYAANRKRKLKEIVADFIRMGLNSGEKDSNFYDSRLKEFRKLRKLGVPMKLKKSAVQVLSEDRAK